MCHKQLDWYIEEEVVKHHVDRDKRCQYGARECCTTEENQQGRCNLCGSTDALVGWTHPYHGPHHRHRRHMPHWLVQYGEPRRLHLCWEELCKTVVDHGNAKR